MSLYVNFWLYNSKKNLQSESPLVMRITLNGNRYDKRTGLWINQKDWDQIKQKLKTKNYSATLTNNDIQTKTLQVRKFYDEICLQKGLNNVSLKDIINKLNSKNKKE